MRGGAVKQIQGEKIARQSLKLEPSSQKEPFGLNLPLLFRLQEPWLPGYALGCDNLQGSSCPLLEAYIFTAYTNFAVRVTVFSGITGSIALEPLDQF